MIQRDTDRIKSFNRAKQQEVLFSPLIYHSMVSDGCGQFTLWFYIKK